MIELLIVVAIIGVLAAIAVPNLLNAQVRAKVARVKSDLRSIAVATDSYRLDHNAYPWPKLGGTYISRVIELSTPVAYLGSVGLQDPFNPENMQEYFEMNVPTYVWVNYRGAWATGGGTQSRYGELVNEFPDGYALNSQGPDHHHSGGVHPPLELMFGVYTTGSVDNVEGGNPYDRIYDPSNGVNSLGDIVRYGGEVAGYLAE